MKPAPMTPIAGMTPQGITSTGVLIRIGLAIALVVLTYNPTGYSYAHWLAAVPIAITAPKVFVGVVLLIGWVMTLRTATVALGRIGFLLGAAFFAALIWLLYDWDILRHGGFSLIAWLADIVVGILLGLGLSWSLLRARATGQIEVQ